MSDYHQRLLEEKRELDERLEKLNNFLVSSAFNNLSLVSQCCLREQSKVMKQYSDILQTRIHIK